MTANTMERIKTEINAAKLVVFMKGTPEAPQCGFSNRVVRLLQDLGYPFHSVDIIANPDIRAMLPEVSNWPTFPQVFVEGKLVGGCDIVTEMHQQGELKPLLEEAFKNK